jgi:hypothetical protein
MQRSPRFLSYSPPPRPLPEASKSEYKKYSIFLFCKKANCLSDVNLFCIQWKIEEFGKVCRRNNLMVHCKKSLATFPSPAGMLPNSPWAVIFKLFPSTESLVVTSRQEKGMSLTFCYGISLTYISYYSFFNCIPQGNCILKPVLAAG